MADIQLNLFRTIVHRRNHISLCLLIPAVIALFLIFNRPPHAGENHAVILLALISVAVLAMLFLFIRRYNFIFRGLKNSETSLQAARDGLERQAVERTADQAAANEHSRGEIEEHKRSAEENRKLEQRNSDQARSVTASQLATIFALAKLAEARDDDTGHHIERVQTYGRVLAERMREMGLNVAQMTGTFVDNLYQTASLHDIGKVGAPDAILLKPGKLTAKEFEEMKKHCSLGANTLAEVLKRHPDNQFLRMGVDVARSHHEKWDGSGYPDGLKGAAIPLAARIVALADFYDAMTSKRCYRPAFSHEDTCRFILEGDGTHFDPDVVTAFRALDGRFRRIRYEMQN